MFKNNTCSLNREAFLLSTARNASYDVVSVNEYHMGREMYEKNNQHYFNINYNDMLRRL